MVLPASKRKSKVSDYGINEDALDLKKHMERLLETVVSVYEQQGVPLPDRKYWQIGTPPEDCAQVVVSLLQIYLGMPGDQAADIQPCNGPVTAVVNIHITRDYPVGEGGQPNSTQAITDAASWGAVDSWVLMKAMKEFDKNEFEQPGFGAIATIAGRPAAGGLQTTVLNLSTAVL